MMTQPSSLTTPEPSGGEPDQPHRRSAERSNVFVIAALTFEDGSGPVRIRNMSHGGALIEGTAIPTERTRVRLIRGCLSVTGEIAWRRDNRGGVRFDCAINIPDWLPHGRRPTGQHRVDEIVFSYKAEISAGGRSAAPAPPASVPDSDVASDLLELKSALVAVAEELAGDPAVATRHLTALQTLDVAAQKLEELAKRV